MKTLRDLSSLPIPGVRPVVTIGNFDGLHVGHQAVLARLIEAARQRDTLALTITFEPHPVKVLRPDVELQLILSYEDKLRTLERLGVDVALVLQFTPELAATPSESFVREVLHEALRAQHVIVGPDSRFGHDRGGDLDQLCRLGSELGFDAEPVAPVHIAGEAVSSTAIRQAVTAGDMERAAGMLGRYHRVRGVVVPGHQRGRTLGFPTANLAPTGELVPADGVYAVRVLHRRERYDAAANVGTKPTFGRHPRLVEAFLFDFDGDLYGESIAVEFVERLRPERRFRNARELAAQVERDLEEARRVLRAASEA